MMDMLWLLTYKALQFVLDLFSGGEMAGQSDPLLEAKLEEAADLAVERFRAARGDITPDEEAVARAQARRIAENPEEFAAGLEQARAVMTSMGLPVPRVLLAEMVEIVEQRGGLEPEKLEALRSQVAALSPITEVGSIKFELKQGDVTSVAHVALAECGADHDLGAELEKIYRRIPSSKKPEVLRHLSALVNAGRRTFGETVERHIDTVRELTAAMPPEFREGPFRLALDEANTTFSLPAPCTKRVGLHVNLRTA